MKKILSLILLSSVLFSCTDDDIKTEQNFAAGPKVVGFAPSFQTVSYFADEGAVIRKFPLDLIGKGNGQYSTTDIVVEYTVNVAETTAQSGLEFDFIGAQGASGVITIPAGSSFGEFPLSINTGSLDPVQKTLLVLDLVATSNGSVIGAQHSKLQIIFVGCKSLIAGNYSKFTTWNNGANSFTRTDEVITETAINTFRTRYVGNWNAGTFTPTGYTLIDICGELTVPDQNLGQYSNEIIGITDDAVPNDGEVTSATTLYTVYNVVPYPGLPNRVFKTFYTKL